MAKAFYAFILAFISTSYVYSQHKYTWKKYSSVAFTENKLLVSPYLELFPNNFINPIETSKADFELRIYLNNQGIFPSAERVVQIKGYSDSVVTYELVSYIEANKNHLPRGKDCEIVKSDSKGKLIACRTRYESNFFDWDSTMNFLIENNLFNIKDQGDLLDSLQKDISKQVIDPCKNVDDCEHFLELIELKFGDKTRSFRLLAPNYYKSNPSISEFKLEHLLAQLIPKILK